MTTDVLRGGFQSEGKSKKGEKEFWEYKRGEKGKRNRGSKRGREV